MKKLNLLEILMFSLALLFASCNDEMLFEFDSNGECRYSSVSPISKESFEKYVVGNGWKCVSAREVELNGKCKKNEYYEGLDGTGPTRCFFTEENMKVYSSVAGYPGYRMLSYRYDGNSNMLTTDRIRSMQILTVNENTMTVLDYANTLYLYSVYQKMTDEELKEYNQYHAVELD